MSALSDKPVYLPVEQFPSGVIRAEGRWIGEHMARYLSERDP
jgi:hypothetical protein